MYLFVYGTLRKSFSARAASAHHRFLSDAIYCSTAYVKGYLYSLGHYPGLLLDENSHIDVKGEIYQINEKTLVALDEYEELDPNNPTNEYQRIEKIITSEEGKKFTVWIYVMNQKPDEKLLIESGDWCE